MGEGMGILLAQKVVHCGYFRHSKENLLHRQANVVV